MGTTGKGRLGQPQEQAARHQALTLQTASVWKSAATAVLWRVTNAPGTEPQLAGSSALLLLQHLHVHAEGLLDGLFGDEADEVLNVFFPVSHQAVQHCLPHHGLGELTGMVCGEESEAGGHARPPVLPTTSRPLSPQAGTSKAEAAHTEGLAGSLNQQGKV